MILSASGARPVSSAYFGLTPRRYQSGDIDYTGRIPKCGDGLMRTYLFEAVNVLLTRVSTCSTLREAWGMRLAKRTGATKAKVALIRKLTVSLHRLWRDGRNDATAIPGTLLERANLGRLCLQHWKAEAPNAIMGWTVFQPRREQWTQRRYQLAPPESLRSRQQLENRAPNSPAVLEKVVWIQGRMMHGWGFVYMQAIVSTDENSTEATFGDVLRQEGNLFSNKDYLAAVADVYFPGQPYSIDIYRTEGRLFRLLQVRDPDYEPPLTDFQPVEAGAAVDVPI